MDDKLLADFLSLDVATRREAVQSYNSQTLDFLLYALNDNDDLVQIFAVDSLGQLHDKRAVETLIKVLETGNDELKCAAATALGKIRDVRAADGLMTALQSSHYNLQNNAAWALAEMGYEPVVPVLLNLLDSPDKLVQATAMHCLVRMIGEQAIEPILKLRNNRELTFHIINTVRGLDDERVIEFLIDCLADTAVQDWAADALGRLKALQAIEPLIELLVAKDSNKKEISSALGQMRELALEPLLSLLKYEDASVRWYAAKALGEIRDKRALPYLEEMVFNDKGKILGGATIKDVALKSIQRIEQGK